MNGDFDCFDENDDENEDSHQKRVISHLLFNFSQQDCFDQKDQSYNFICTHIHI